MNRKSQSAEASFDAAKRRTEAGTEQPVTASGSQTLLRGLDLLEAVAAGTLELGDLSATLGLSRSTTHRLASTLVDRRYLKFVPKEGYSLGPKLLDLGFRAQKALPIPRIARPFLERLSEACEDTIHLGVLDGGWALYLDKIPGKRRIEISSRVGERHPICSTGLGKALILGMDEASWRTYYAAASNRPAHRENPTQWLTEMRAYAQKGVAYDLEENEPQIRCVAAPIRNAAGEIVAAFSVSSMVRFMDEKRMEALADDVRRVAAMISQELGWATM